MFFSVNRLVFIEEINKCNRIIDPKAPTPSLSGILLEVETDKISLISSNTSMSIKTTIDMGNSDLLIKQTGSILIRGKYFLEILRRMDDDVINISSVEENLVSLSGEKSEFSLNILNYVDYPAFAFREKGDNVTVNNIDLKKSLNQTIISVNEWNQKIVLAGLNFALDNSLFYITGTDGFRVSRKRIQLLGDIPEKFETNIPHKSILEIIKLLPEKGECKIVSVDSHVTFIINNTIFQTTILEGQFPNVNAVFPTDFNTTLYMDNKKFFKLISRADIPSEDNASTVVNLILSDDSIFIKSNIHQIGSFEEVFKEFEIKGLDEQNICFNSKYLIDSLKTFETKNIEINLIDSKKPIVISSAEDMNLSQIILPMFSN
ncbi:DNA polymerase III subunit beta [Spiroplasma sp. BIUS-1]|uniref:DNA polymerase III subunit beta n=1 Tax=Spiroplasma sp. BIUS-1 TaxID=216964 RepID=UPI001397FF66|nr:DNA polymerase III subunit beta [Spiroplasma sp. BIUS-1]QHX36255.1 DNA polymerase III subunit beta [Spiroplasma sp. BIUS-1]